MLIAVPTAGKAMLPSHPSALRAGRSLAADGAA
jgi:hypothetical protein